jgi:membrane fusion protein, heavy metal efflux system
MNRVRFVLLLPLVVASIACHKESSEPDAARTATDTAQKPAAIRTQTVTVQSFARTVETTGSVAFDQDHSTQVLAPISGPVGQILVNIGTRVARGQALATVASPDFAAAVGAVRKAEATAHNARKNAALDEELFKNDGISRREMEQAQTDAINAEADLDAAVQQLRALGVDETSIKDIEQNRPVRSPSGVIRAPLSGTVVEKLISPGQLLQAGATACFTVADVSRMWVLANVFTADLPFVKVGDPADVIIGSGQAPLTGRVESIADVVDPNTRAVAVRIGVANRNGILKRDLYVRVAIHSQQMVTGVLLPSSAILRDEQNLPFVFVAQQGGTYARRSVQIGQTFGDQQEVTSGLQQGESVVVQGGLFLGGASEQ